jgi:rare lipoprotein A
MNPHALTAAHRSLPFGSRVRVTNRKNGRSAVVRITDRGPFVRGRVIDLTPAAARALGFSGLASVSIARVMG